MEVRRFCGLSYKLQINIINEGIRNSQIARDRRPFQMQTIHDLLYSNLKARNGNIDRQKRYRSCAHWDLYTLCLVFELMRHYASVRKKTNHDFSPRGLSRQSGKMFLLNLSSILGSHTSLYFFVFFVSRLCRKRKPGYFISFLEYVYKNMSSFKVNTILENCLL